MNLGLDSDACGRFTLTCDDEFQGKLAFFDHYVLHWRRTELIDFLARLTAVRNQFLNVLLKGEYRPVYLSWQDGTICNASYWTSDTAVIALANLKMSECTVSVLLDRTVNDAIEVMELQSWDESGWRVEKVSNVIDCTLSPLGFKLYALKFRWVRNR